MSFELTESSFYINLPVGAFAATVIFFTFSVPDTARNSIDRSIPLREVLFQMDLPGLILIVGAIQCLLLALYWGGVTKSWSSNDVIGTLLGFGLLSLAFIAVEFQQGRYAMIVHELIGKREVWVGSAFSFL